MVWLLGGHCPWRGQVPATCCCPLAKCHFHAVPVPLARAAPSPGSSQPLADDVLVGGKRTGPLFEGLLWRGFGTCPLFASLPCCQEGQVGYGQRRLSPGSGGTVGGDSRGT